MYESPVEANDETLSDELVGKKIVSIDTGNNEIVLNDGTVLELEDNQECCAWFNVDGITEIDLDDNIVTAVREEATTLSDPNESAFDMVILSRDKTLARIQVDGDVSNGYYCHSIILKVRQGK